MKSPKYPQIPEDDHRNDEQDWNHLMAFLDMVHIGSNAVVKS